MCAAFMGTIVFIFAACACLQSSQTRLVCAISDFTCCVCRCQRNVLTVEALQVIDLYAQMIATTLLPDLQIQILAFSRRVYSHCDAFEQLLNC